MSKNKLIPELRFPEFGNEEEWKEKELNTFLDYLQPTDYLVKSTDYNDDYKTPVLTAGKSFILGYTNETEGIFKKDLPVIIFDDFTTASQFVDFPFKGKSSAMKILTAKENTDIKFAFEAMQLIKYEVGVHQRHWISVFSNLKIPAPKLVEQQKIASCLSSLDELIEAHNQKLELLKDHKKGLMQNLFPQEGEKVPKLRFEEFEGEWEEKKLEDIIIDFIVPMRDKPKNLTGSIPWCRIEDFDGMYLRKSKSVQGVAEKTVKEMNLKVYPINTLLVSCSADLGRCAITQSPLITNQTFIGLVPDEELVNVIFLYYVMSNSRSELNARSSGTTISYLSRKEFEQFEVIIPDIKEQQKIASTLAFLDELITAQTEKIEQLKEHKKGLMQGLFPKMND